MKAGDYVRLPDGIHKIKEYEYRPEYENCHCMYLDDNDYGLLFTDKELIKHSPNIIDLIEVGDYVNGKEVLEIKKFGSFKGIKVFGDIYYNEEIKTIVTKEQFKIIQYKIGGNR